MPKLGLVITDLETVSLDALLGDDGLAYADDVGISGYDLSPEEVLSILEDALVRGVITRDEVEALLSDFTTFH